MSEAQRYMEKAAEFRLELECSPLVTRQLQESFIEQMAMAMAEVREALSKTIDEVRTNPTILLQQTFRPNIIDMDPRATAQIQVTCFPRTDVRPAQVLIVGKTILGSSFRDEVAFRAIVGADGIITPNWEKRADST